LHGFNLPLVMLRSPLILSFVTFSAGSHKSGKNTVQGQLDIDLISTSHAEKQNHTLRMHCRRLSRLTDAFSKKSSKISRRSRVALRLLQFRKVS